MKTMFLVYHLWHLWSIRHMWKVAATSSIKSLCYNARMIRDTLPFRNFYAYAKRTASARFISSALQLLEEKLGAQLLYDVDRLPHPYPELADLLALAETMRAHGTIRAYGPMKSIADEPRMSHWFAECGNTTQNKTAGAAWKNDRLALTRTLAEANERYLWYEKIDFGHPTRIENIARMPQQSLLPERFAGFSSRDRETHKKLAIDTDSQFAWIRGYSWTKHSSIWIPLQTVSAFPGSIRNHSLEQEPLIRPRITNGLASHTTKNKAIRAGALELLERDAYIITWLNQISPPRIDISTLEDASDELRDMVRTCRRYNLTPHIVRLLTDAPVYALCAVLEDRSGAGPRYAFGLKAGNNAAHAATGALLEALRAHRGIRTSWQNKKFDPNAPVRSIGHYDRLQYWAHGNNHERLAFFIAGHIKPLQEEFEKDSEEAHLQRIVAWCRNKSYELASVSFTTSKHNHTPWHIESVVIPELQPAYLLERIPSVSGKRLREVPKLLGYEARETPFIDAPHPFA